jgi:hypothetical protein
VVIANNPFYSTSNAKIKGVIGHTSDGELLVELEYIPEVVKKMSLPFLESISSIVIAMIELVMSTAISSLEKAGQNCSRHPNSMVNL